MKKRISLLVVLVGLLPALVAPSGQADPMQVDLATLLATEFQAPALASERQYLGLSEDTPFRLPQIRAQVIVVEVFSMYCPICQAGALDVNRLHNLIESNPRLRGDVKILGIGIGNTPYEVDIFRKKYRIAFPLVPDPDAAIRKSSAEIFRTPTFVVLEKKSGTHVRVMKVHVGRIGNVDDFLGSMNGQ